MRKKLSLFLLALITGAGTMFASDTQVDGIWYDFYDIEDTIHIAYVAHRGEYSVSYESEYTGSVVIPETVIYNSIIYKVTGIGYEAFARCKYLTSVTIPRSIYHISSNAFNECYGLSAVYISDIVAWCSINFEDNYANPLFLAKKLYLDNVLVENLVIPNSVHHINAYAFLGCNSLTSIELPNSLKTIDGHAFRGACLSSITIPDSVTSIGAYAFYGSSTLTSAIIGDSVKYIGYGAFGDCSALKSIAIGKSVTSIDDAIYRCGKLDTVKINSDSIVSKNYSANGFQKLFGQQVKKYIIGDDVKSIGDYTFYNCSSLTSVEIPNSVTNIGSNAFHSCRSLTSVMIPDNVISINSGAFGYCSGLDSVDIPDNVTSIGNYAFRNCSNLSSISIGNNVASIGDGAFYECSKLDSINLPCSVEHIGENAFYGCGEVSRNCNKEIVQNLPMHFCSEKDVPEWVLDIILRESPNASFPNMEGTYVFRGKTTMYDDSIVNIIVTTGTVSYVQLPDTTLCYGEELVIDGVQCTIQKTPNIRQTWTRSLTTVEGCDSTISISVLWKRVAPSYDFKFTLKDAYDTPNTGSISWTVSGNTDYKYDYYTVNGKKYGSTTGLKSGEYRLVFYGEECNDSVVKNITISQLGIRVNNQYYLLDSVNHTATLTYRGVSSSDYNNEYSGNITIPQTITYGDEEYQVTGIGSNAFYGCNNITTVTLESKTPLSAYNIGLTSNAVVYVPYGSLSLYKADSYWKNYKLRVINPSHISATTGATSATITLGAGEEVNHIASCGIVEGESTAGNILEYIGLEPNSTYSDVPFYVMTVEGDSDVLSCSFTTTALELTTKPSQPVSSSVAILLAETNMSDAETSCGFEYKRNDAPADMDGTKVYCPVASGTMAGRLKNLKDDVYYKYRAFYQSAAGKMYYGDWQYIFTGDVAVEFDPVLYTYTATAVTESTATISGYALAGATDFAEQGFEYWAESRADIQGNVQSTKAPLRKQAALGEHCFVQASGIIMHVTLTNLDAGTVYKYRAYGKVGEQYYYGSEQSFTTRGTYTPPTYTIKFVNWDGTELQSSQVVENAMPEYNGETPTRPETAAYTYTFKGWTPEIVAATANATYTATYTATAKEVEPVYYTITFINWDEEVLQVLQVEEGEKPVYTGETPTRPEDENYTYTFNGWSPSIQVAWEDATYMATFTAEEKSEDITNVQGDKVQCTKVLRDGQIFILRGEKVFTPTGQEVK